MKGYKIKRDVGNTYQVVGPFGPLYRTIPTKEKAVQILENHLN